MRFTAPLTSQNSNSSAQSSNNASSSSNRIMILLTNQAFIPHKNRWEEEQSSQSAESKDPRRHCRAFTGVDVYELAYIWVALTQRSSSNVKIELVSPWGGAVPSDPDSLNRLMKDDKLLSEISSVRDFITLLDHTWPIKAVRPEEYKCAIVVGSYGAMFDLPQCATIQHALTQIYRNNGYVCTIGHGAAVLANLHNPEHASSPSKRYLIHDKKIACPTNREEKEKKVERYLPFLVEDKLKERGARIQESDPFKSNVVIDERLITAQNAASIKDFIRKIGEKAFNKSIEIWVQNVMI